MQTADLHCCWLASYGALLCCCWLAAFVNLKTGALLCRPGHLARAWRSFYVQA
uniref:Uncharacterized protein n=1 Tax=Zea mays TaxID=4577 RepID=B6SPP2_MAIZE|nr:hypothetical protein [Zea mays]